QPSVCPSFRCLALDLHDVRRLKTLRALGRLELDLRTLCEGLEAVAGDAREVHEEISASVGRRDEAVALRIAEPLDSSGCHDTPPSTNHERVRKAMPRNQLLVLTDGESVADRVRGKRLPRQPRGTATRASAARPLIRVVTVASAASWLAAWLVTADRKSSRVSA